jgi:plastocyanin
MKKVIAAFVVLVAAAFVLAAAPAKVKTHTIVIEAMQFHPAHLTVAVGDRVVWENRDLVPHTASGSGFDSQVIAAGKQWHYTTAHRGEFSYKCTFHPTMKGTLQVK